MDSLVGQTLTRRGESLVNPIVLIGLVRNAVTFYEHSLKGMVMYTCSEHVPVTFTLATSLGPYC